MNLYLMRHCEPTPGPPMDSSRSLTADGVKQADQMAEFLVREIGRVDYVLTSPFLRCTQTAEIMGKALGSPVIATTNALEPNSTPAEAWPEVMRLAIDSTDVLIVSHHEMLGPLLFWLLGLAGTEDAIRFEWGGIAHLKGKPQAMELRWHVTPKMVLRDEDEEAVLEAVRALSAAT